MKSLIKEANMIEDFIKIEETKQSTKFILNEMKKIGIEKLPYSYSSLKSFIDAETMSIHYNRHYKSYVEKLNLALEKRKGDKTLEEIIRTINQYSKAVRNNAGGAFNHALFWKMLSPKKQKPEGLLYDKILKEFGTYSSFQKKFETEAKNAFGSGWVWLVLTKEKNLKIMTTPNQDNPLMNVIEDGGYPILGLDLWEHAYYLKYKNKKDEYVKNFWNVVNWKFITELYTQKIGSKINEGLYQKLLEKKHSE
jgi:Fe-Mn family superoxide dismutase